MWADRLGAARLGRLEGCHHRRAHHVHAEHLAEEPEAAAVPLAQSARRVDDGQQRQHVQLAPVVHERGARQHDAQPGARLQQRLRLALGAQVAAQELGKRRL